MIKTLHTYYDVLTSFVHIICENFNKFKQFLNELWLKTHTDKNKTKAIYR